MTRVRAAAVLLVLAASTARARAENYDHPGLVFTGKDGWLSPDQATAKGYARYHRRWLPKTLAPKLAAWEAEDAKHASWKDAYKEESQHYRIVTTAPHFILELEIVPFLDALYDAYVQVFKTDFGLTGKGANKRTIKIHGGYEEYALEEPENGKPRARENPGYFDGDALVVYYDDADPGEFYATVFHEGTHQFVSGLLPGANLPMWLDEGIAVYFEGCMYSRATKKIVIDHMPPDRVEEAQKGLEKVPVSDKESLANRLFMDVRKEDFGSEQYALAWSFLHYLINADGGKSRDGFARFLRAMNGTGTKAVSEVFEETTKLKLKVIQRGWRDHVLAWKKPAEPIWASLVTEGEGGPDPGIHAGDRVWSVDGVEVGNADAFNELWEKRPQDRPTELVVVRRTPVEGWIEYRDQVVTLSIPPGVTRKVSAEKGEPRGYNLKD